MDGFDYIHALEAELNRWNRAAEDFSATYLRTQAAMEETLRGTTEDVILEDALTTMRFMVFVIITTRNILEDITTLRLKKRPEEGKE